MIDPALKPVLTDKVTVRWGDMDAFAHVNNAVYLRYMDEVRVNFFTALGLDINTGDDGPLIMQTSGTYLKAVEYPDELRVDFYLDAPGRSSFMTYNRMFSQRDPDVIVFEGSAKIVWFDRVNEVSAPMPDIIRNAIEQQAMPEMG